MFVWVLRRIYYYVIMNVKLLWIAWISITKDILSCYSDFISRLWNVCLRLWLALTNGIRDEWLGYDWWLALANGILERWPCGVLWLASANGIWDGWLGCDWWFASTNDILEGWSGCV